MTTGGHSKSGPDMSQIASYQLTENLAKIEMLAARLKKAVAGKDPILRALQGPSEAFIQKAFGAYFAELVQDPAAVFERQTAYWTAALEQAVQANMSGEEDLHNVRAKNANQPDASVGQDKRFSHPLWDTSPYFKFMKTQYLTHAGLLEETVRNLQGIEEEERRQLAQFTKQFVDMCSPANILATNPDALETAVQTQGASLVQGLENFVEDLEDNEGELVVSLADKNAFDVGRNLGCTPGTVVFKNRMFELIQYAPTTKNVYRRPLLIFPPWINKFYIFDLQAQNSFIKWVVDQGYTVFIVSWVNPDAQYSDVTLDTYIEEGFVPAITAVKDVTGEAQVNAVGYCISGTTLSIALGLLRQRGDNSISSATLLTTMTDFSAVSEMDMFFEDSFVDGIAAEAARTGLMKSAYMARTFASLRANELIYKPAVRFYLLGEKRPAFDLLYWNSDSTNLPGPMAVQYLRKLCRENTLATTGFSVCGTKVHLRDVQVPLCGVGCERDHIANWAASYGGIQNMGSPDKTFILSESGHISGIINPPHQTKYGHYSNANMDLQAEPWKAGAEFTQGSWWMRWEAWLSQYSGEARLARAVEDPLKTQYGAAPGSYVLRSSRQNPDTANKAS